MPETFASRRRALLDALQSDLMQAPPKPAMPPFNATLPQGLEPYVRGYGAQPPVMAGMGTMMGMQNPPRSMGGPQGTMGFGSLPLPQGSVPAPDLPAPGSTAVPNNPPMPPQRPAMFGNSAPAPSVPMPPQRPEGLGSNDPFALISGFNPQAFAGNPQAVANQFTEGDLARLAARTYRNEDGSLWNDFYVK